MIKLSTILSEIRIVQGPPWEMVWKLMLKHLDNSGRVSNIAKKHGWNLDDLWIDWLPKLSQNTLNKIYKDLQQINEIRIVQAPTPEMMDELDDEIYFKSPNMRQRILDQYKYKLGLTANSGNPTDFKEWISIQSPSIIKAIYREYIEFLKK